MRNRKKINELKNDIKDLELKIKQTSDKDEKNALLAEKKKKEKDLIKEEGTIEFEMKKQLNKEKSEKQAINNYQNFKSKVVMINQLNIATKRYITIKMNQNIEKGKMKGLAA